jgi:hypothetical protein
MLEGAKKNIVVVITKNDEVIVAKRRSSITLEDLNCIVRVEVVCKLTLAEESLKIAIRSINQSFNVGLLKDFEISVCEMNDITHVQVQSEMSLQGANLGCRPNIYENKLKDFETRKECAMNTLKSTKCQNWEVRHKFVLIKRLLCRCFYYGV